MVTPSVGTVVLVRFPFSDLTASKLRPAVVLANAERGDWVLYQITSQSYADRNAIGISNADFVRGSLNKPSYARPAKLFTANNNIMMKSIGDLSTLKLKGIRVSVISIFK
ncbi:MAG TPA: type II toxin-antitoxin system PemK/MazF family toxin [Pyrinomonadaceae bacterium]|nr:type II toxin-antitoxin system PemK/MazF family toxin [Acidobacteriota bacterium]HQZ97244.1 type II toxin-antitoxin system PemK/MazF family toxin [Pyrinomonadaceae bacterium]